VLLAGRAGDDGVLVSNSAELPPTGSPATGDGDARRRAGPPRLVLRADLLTPWAR